ncbi:MAG: hypothetical protein ABFE13_12040 [Phycisphaerales bacterium]
MAKYTGDVSYLKRGMKAWQGRWNNNHPSDQITFKAMDLTSDSWGDNVKTNFWRMCQHVTWLAYEPYPTVQLYDLVYPSQNA